MTETAPRTTREAAWSNLQAEPRTTVLIVGGGINGAAVFRDLALQGIDCLIVDKGDWCSGTSAAPSRLIHGGLKYLETGELRLVAESTRERNLLLRNAPHVVHPLPSVVPIRSYFGGIVPSARRFLGLKAPLVDRGLLIVEAGMAIYDLLGLRHRAMPLHRMSLRRNLRRRFPRMSPDVLASAIYYDARVSQAERLGFELIADGQRAHRGARALNYVAAIGAEGGRVTLQDQRTPETVAVHPDVIVNAGGPWIDRVNATLGRESHHIGGAKGSHIILDNPELVRELNGHMIYFGGSDGRVCLLYPFFGQVLVGSTDIPFDDPDRAVCEADEADYMLAMVREIFPQIAVSPGQVIFRYAGVRPLPNVQAADPGSVSRDHSLTRDDLPGIAVPVFSLIGGKWTTFRAFAAEASDSILALLGRQRRISTEFEPIGGGRDFPTDPDARAAWLARFAARNRVSLARAAILLERYGTHAERMAASDDIHSPLMSLPDYWRSEIQRIVRDEQVVTLADLAFRRTPIAVAGLLSVSSLHELADVTGSVLGWTSLQRQHEVDRTSTVARERHGVRLHLPQDGEAALEGTGRDRA